MQLNFASATARVVNTERCVLECLENAQTSLDGTPNLLIFNATLGHKFRRIFETTRASYPSADVVITSCCGVVGQDGVSETAFDMGVMMVQGEQYSISHCDGFYGYSAYEKTLQLAQDLKDQNEDINMVYFVGSGIDTNNSEVLSAFNEIFGNEVTIFGATSSDNMKGIVNYQGVNDNVYEHGAFAIGFSDPSLIVSTQASHGFRATGDPMVVTKSSGHIINEIDGQPAWSTYCQKLGLDADANCGDTIPIGALAEALEVTDAQEYGNPHILRVVTKHEGDNMYYATSIKEGTKLWLTVRDEDLIFQDTRRMCSSLKMLNEGRKIEAVFHADCLARGRSLFGRILKEELVAEMQNALYQEGSCPPWLGLYGFGEFARLGNENMYHNYTTALYVLSRKRFQNQ